MNMVFKVFKAGTLIFTSTIKLQQGASLAQINEFTKVAEIQFRKAHPLIDLTDVEVMQRWEIDEPAGNS
jgi:hypothetical protein